ncbi:hypothetical protein PWT90_07744 [Aphanocladium album]|nr:hypothetical protein PWT90_07744 [Aphanocladium album]
MQSWKTHLQLSSPVAPALQSSSESPPASTALVHEAEPPQWDLAQSLRYFYTVVQPELLGRHSLRIVNPAPFIFNILDHAVKTASKARGRLLNLREEPAFSGMWKNYLSYLVLHMQNLNKTIQDGYPNKTKVLRDTLLLVAADITANSSIWQTHFSGSFAYLEHVGGVKLILREPYECSPLVSLMELIYLRASLLCNTTSPARKQVSGFYRYTDDEIRAVFEKDELSGGGFHLPIDLKIVLVQITRCRVDAATYPGQSTALESRVRDIFKQLDTVDVDNWNKRDKYPSGYVSHESGFVFQLAIRLFGMMTLPRWAVMAALQQDSDTRPWNEQLAIRRQELIKVLQRNFPAVKFLASLKWPLIVAGVAATAGDAAVEHQTFVDQSLYKLWQHPLTNNDVVIILEKLRSFWSSGKTEWEECFDEPSPC